MLDRFLSWIATAPVEARCEAARALVGAYGRPDAEPHRRRHLDGMVAVLLDDTSVTVRRALAEAAATSRDVPRPLVAALARDESRVALPVLQHSPLLGEADLLAAAAVGDDALCGAVASRDALPATIGAILAERASREAILILCRNAGAALPSATLRRILARFPGDDALRAAMTERAGLEAGLRAELTQATAEALTALAVERGWMTPRRAAAVVAEECEKAAVTLAAAASGNQADLYAFVDQLRSERRLTLALLLRSLMSGETALFEGAVSRLARVPGSRAAGLVRAPEGLAFASLYAKAGLPPQLLPTFRVAVTAADRCGRERPSGKDVSVLPSAVARVRDASAAAGSLPELQALLSRLEAEALRDHARARQRALQVADIPPRETVRPEPPVWVPPRRPVFRLPFRSAA